MAGRAEDMTVDQLFGLYRTSGRPKWLAAVFDQTAPELLRVALHTTRDPHRAEDLVQACFVTAIQRAGSYEPHRRVLPWLLGILGNLAREELRRERRTPDPDRLTERSTTTPESAAATGELDRAVDDAIQTLPEPYRPVLVLHLQHDMAPAEIAHALGRGPGTVRSQLARGLERLRRVLPASFASSLALLALPTRGLAAVRRAVVWRATLAAPGLALASIGPRAIGWIAAGAVLTTIAAYLGSSDPSTNESDPKLVVERPASSVAPPPRGREPETRPTDDNRSLVASANSEHEAANCALEIRVLDARGLPLVDAAVRVRPITGPDLALSELLRRTDARGVATFARLRAGDVTVTLDRADGPTLSLLADELHRVDCRLEPGSTVRGQVVDMAGVAIAGAAIWLARGGRSEQGVVAMHTDSAGRFELTDVARDHHVAAFAPGFHPCASMPIDPTGDHRLRLRRGAATLRGRVTDEHGNPLTGARVHVGIDAPPFWLVEEDRVGRRMVTNRIAGTARTDERGLYEIPAAETGTAVEVFVRARGHAGERRVLMLPTGSQTVADFTLPRGGIAGGRVTRDAKPVTGAHVLGNAPRFGAPPWFWPSARTDARGRYEIHGLLEGGAMLRVFSGGQQQASAPIVITSGQRQACDIAFGDGLTLLGSVRNAKGRPMAGVLVRLDRERETRTRDDGSFAFSIDDHELHELTIHDPECAVAPALERRTGVRLGDNPVIVTMTDAPKPSATLLGRVLPRTGGPIQPATVRLRRGDQQWSDFPTTTDGTFSIAPLTPGPYEILVTVTDGPPIRFGVRTLPAHTVTDIGTHMAGAGGHLDIRGQHRGVPISGRLNLRIIATDGSESAERVVELPHTLRWLPVGRHRIVAWRDGLGPIVRAVEVTADSTQVSELVFEALVRVDITVHHHSTRKPAKTLAASWHDENGTLLATTHYFGFDDPTLQFTQRLEPGRYSIVLRDEVGREGRTTLTVTPGAALVTQSISLE